MNDLFSRRSIADAVRSQAPGVNLWVGEDEVQVTAELPGIDIQQVEASVHGSQLTLKGSYAARELKEGEQWLRQERPAYSFARTLQLPFEVEAAKVDATYAHGVLTLILPRAEAEKPKRIPIKGTAQTPVAAGSH